MPEQIRETAVLTETAAADAASSGRMLVQFISPGWGSSGYYSPQVLEAAAADRVIPAGTHMYADHPTDTDVIERPERSIRDLMAITVEDARLAEDGALVGEVQVVPQWRDLVETVRDAIGVSIRGSATDIVEGEAEGRRGGIIEGLVPPVQSVDFVTRAGRGGRVLQLLESARANQRAVRRGIAEATVNDTREALNTAIRDAYGGEDTWVWVRDFDETTVWFDVEGEGDENGIYAQPYTQSDGGAVELTGERTEVRVVTTYVPATRPDGNTTQESQEDTMPHNSIEEAERSLAEANGRVTTLESERDTAIQERDEARRALAAHQRVNRAQVLVAERATEAQVSFDPLQVRGLLVDLPVTEGGDFDEAAFTTRVDEAAAEVRSRQGAGTVTGFGGAGSTGGSEITESDIDKAVASAWGRPVKEA